MNNEELKTSKAYQALNQEEPLSSPPDLDAAILALAHKAVQAKPQAVVNSPRKYLTLRWSAPIASAALIVLSVTVFILMPELEQHQAVQSYKQDSAAAIESEIESDFAGDTQRHELLAASALQKEKKREQASQMQANDNVAKRIRKSKAMPHAPQLQGFSGDSRLEVSDMATQPMPLVALEEELAEAVKESSVMSPEQWSKRILELIAAGDWLNADIQYAAFAKHYPEHAFKQEYLKLKKQHATDL